MDALTGVVFAGASAASLWVVRRARVRTRRAALDRRLEAFGTDPPLETGHLPPKLQAVVTDARASRLSLETPLRRALAAWDQMRPWELRARLADFDRAMVDARALLWGWLHNIAGLGAMEFSLLRKLGLDPRPVRTLIYRSDVFDRIENPFATPMLPQPPDVDLLTRELVSAMEVLRSFETSLLCYRPSAYR